MKPDPEPKPTSGPDYHAEHDAWLARSARAYRQHVWCGECAYGVVEDPPCCTQPEGTNS